jgi:hypothetical protein
MLALQRTVGNQAARTQHPKLAAGGGGDLELPEFTIRDVDVEAVDVPVAPPQARPDRRAPMGQRAPGSPAQREYAEIRRIVAVYKSERRSAAPGGAARLHELLAQIRTLSSAWLDRYPRADPAVVASLEKLSQRAASKQARLRKQPGRDAAGHHVKPAPANPRQRELDEIGRLLADYKREKSAAQPGNEARLLTMLNQINTSCRAWVKRYPDADAAAVARLERVSLGVSSAQAKLLKRQAHRIYLDSLTAGAANPDVRGADAVPAEAYEHRFQAATPGSRMRGVRARAGFAYDLKMDSESMRSQHARERMRLVQDKGLTPAEHAAFLVFTGQDYEYINPAQSHLTESRRLIDPDDDEREKTWLQKSDWWKDPDDTPPWRPDPGVDDDAYGPDDDDLQAIEDEPREINLTAPPVDLIAVADKDTGHDQFDEKVLQEEGRLHTAMAVSGMHKLDPFTGISYRGETVEEMTLKPGDVKSYVTLVSTSKNPGRAVEFGCRGIESNVQRGGNRDTIVLWCFDHAGGDLPGRDVEALAVVKAEAEVLLFPGSTFRITAVRKYSDGPPPGPLGTALAQYAESDQWSPRLHRAKEIYIVNAKMRSAPA